MSRSDYDDMPSNGGGRRGKGNKGLTLGVLICILVVLIIIVVRLIFKPEEKLEVLPPNAVVKENSVTNEVSDKSETPTLAEDSAVDLSDESIAIVDDEPTTSKVDETPSLEIDVIERGEDIITDVVSQTMESPEEVIDDSIETEGVIEESEVNIQDETIIEENNDALSSIEDEEPLFDTMDESSLESGEAEDYSESYSQVEEIETESEIVVPDNFDISTEEIEDLYIEETPKVEPIIVLDNPSEEKVETLGEEPVIDTVEEANEEPVETIEIEETIDEPIEEEPLSYDPFMEEDVETLRKGLGDLLSKINFSLVLAEEEPVIEEEKKEELTIDEPFSEIENESDVVDIPVLSDEGEEVIIEESQVEGDEELSIDDSDVELITEGEAGIEESEEVSKTFVIEEKSSDIIPGSIVIVDGERITLLSTPGKAVMSPIDGVVREAKKVEGKKTISIETEDGEVWRFSGFERVNVKINQSIKEGEVLGSVGTSSGSSIDISLI